MNDHKPEWEGQLHLPIQAVRSLNDVLEYFMKVWPGSPARPPEEQEFVRELLQCMKRLQLEHSFDCLEKKSD